MSERQGYSRLYWSVMDDEKFDGIREDVRAFGTWSLMLLVADMAYPSPAYMPPTVPKSACAKLVEAGLVDLLAGHRFRIRGLAAERTRRSDAARVGGLASGRSRSVEPNRTTVEQPLNERSTSREGTKSNLVRDEYETSTRQEAEAGQPPDPAAVYWNLTGRYPKDKALAWVDDLTSQYGSEAVIRALATTHQSDASTNTLLSRTEDVLRHDARVLGLKEQAEARERLKERRAAPQAEVDPIALQGEIQKILRGEAA